MVHAPPSLLHFTTPITSDESTRWHCNSPPSSFFLPLCPNAPQQPVLEHNHANAIKVYVGSRGTDPFIINLGPCSGHRTTSCPRRFTAGTVCQYPLSTRLCDPPDLPWRVGDIFVGENGGNLPASLRAKYYFVGGLEVFPVVWLRTSAVAYYVMSVTGYPAAGRNVPEGTGPYLCGRWEVVYLITLAVNWLIGISNSKDTDKNSSSRKTDNLTFLRIQNQTSIPGKKYIRQNKLMQLT